MDFYIIIKKRVAEVLSSGGRLPLLVCGNRDNRIIFSFDNEWTLGALKTARFVYRENMGKGRLVYRDVPFTGNFVSVPVFENVSELWVGVTSSSGITTSAARFACLPSIGGFSAVESDDSSGSADSGSGAVTTEAVEVSLLLSEGDQTVKTASGNPMSKVTIKKPATLLPLNIRSGVTIAGVTGTYAPSDSSEPATLTAPVISIDGDNLNISYTAAATVALRIFDDGDDTSGVITPESDGNMTVYLPDLMAGNMPGTSVITVGAYGLDDESEISNAVSYNFVEKELPAAPTVSLDGTILSMTSSWGAEAKYRIYGSSDGVTFRLKEVVEGEEGTTYYDLGEYIDSGIVYFYVEAENATTGERSANSEHVEYVPEEEPSEPIGEVTLSLDGTTLVIEQSGGLSSTYHLWRKESLSDAYWVQWGTIARTASPMRVDLTRYLEVGSNYFMVSVYDEDDTEINSDPVFYMLLSGLTEPTISLDGSVLKITPGEGVATSYEILRSEDGVTYSTAATVDANGDEVVTVDITEYAVYEETYFKVRAVNTDTGESVETKAAVTYAPDHSGVYTLSVIGGGTGFQNQFYYAVNMSTEDFGGGKYDGIINGEGVIEGLSYGDVVFIRPYSWTSTIEVLDADDTFTYTIEYDNFLVVATNIEGDGSITLKNILA